MSESQRAPSTPRRESKDPTRISLAARHPRWKTSNGSGAANAPAIIGGGANPAAAADSPVKVNEAAATLRRPSRWGIIRKDVIPQPQFLKVSEKIQHIIQYVPSLLLVGFCCAYFHLLMLRTLRKLPEDRSESDILFP